MHKTNHNVTNEERDLVLNLSQHNLNTGDIAGLTGISRSLINYINQAYLAAERTDIKTLTRLAKSHKPTVKWAMSKFEIYNGYELPEYVEDKPIEVNPNNEVDTGRLDIIIDLLVKICDQLV